MMKYLVLLISAIILSSCTELEVEEASLPDISNLSPANIKTDLAIFNITTDPDDFDYMIGNPGLKYYAPCSLSQWKNGVEVFNGETALMEIKGVSSAYKSMKSLGLIFSKTFDNKANPILVPKNVLKHHSLDGFEGVRFRNSGNDFGFTMLKDISYTELAIRAGLDVELMYFQQSHVFVNGEYYGLLNLRTENERHGMAGLQATKIDSITVMKIDVDNGNLEWNQGPRDAAIAFEQTLDDKNAEEMWSMIDESSFIDYLIYQDYIGNTDWPHNNSRMYSEAGKPFRFILYDTDFAAFKNKNPILPKMEYRKDDLSKLYRLMREKSGFDSRLKSRQKELYNFFSPARFNAIVDQNSQTINDDIGYLMALYDQPFSYFEWAIQLDLLKEEFRKRDKHIRKKYNL